MGCSQLEQGIEVLTLPPVVHPEFLQPGSADLSGLDLPGRVRPVPQAGWRDGASPPVRYLELGSRFDRRLLSTCAAGFGWNGTDQRGRVGPGVQPGRERPFSSQPVSWSGGCSLPGLFRPAAPWLRGSLGRPPASGTGEGAAGGRGGTPPWPTPWSVRRHIWRLPGTPALGAALITVLVEEELAERLSEAARRAQPPGRWTSFLEGWKRDTGRSFPLTLPRELCPQRRLVGGDYRAFSSLPAKIARPRPAARSTPPTIPKIGFLPSSLRGWCLRFGLRILLHSKSMKILSPALRAIA